MSLGTSFWRLFASSGTSNLADGVALVTLPLLAASITRDPIPVSALAAVSYLPWLLFAVPGGALVDRLDRRRAMAGANAVRAALYGGLAILVATDLTTMPLLYAAAMAVGCAEVIYDASIDSRVPVTVVEKRMQGRDHPVLLGVPETYYLKCLILRKLV